MSKYTFTGWRRVTLPKRAIIPSDHGLYGNTSNSTKLVALNAVRQFILAISLGDGHQLPIPIRRSDVKTFGEVENDEETVVLPPLYTKHSLHKEYIDANTSTNLDRSLNTFIDELEKDFPHIRVSLRSRVLCDLCFLLERLSELF